MSDDIKFHSRTKYGLSDLLSDIGGLYEVLYIFILAILTPINNIKFLNKAIRAVYISEQHQESDLNTSVLKPVKFNMKHSLFQRIFSFCKIDKHNEKDLYKQGELKLKNDLNLLRMI